MLKDMTLYRNNIQGRQVKQLLAQGVSQSRYHKKAPEQATSATAAGIGAGVVSNLGAIVLSATCSIAADGLTVAAVGAAIARGVAAEKGMGKDTPTAADELGEDFYKVILQEEPFKSTPVESIVKSYHWAPYIPLSTDSSMLSVLLLLSKYRLRNVPVIELGQPLIKNFITQSAVVHGLEECKGRDGLIPFLCIQ